MYENQRCTLYHFYFKYSATSKSWHGSGGGVRTVTQGTDEDITPSEYKLCVPWSCSEPCRMLWSTSGSTCSQRAVRDRILCSFSHLPLRHPFRYFNQIFQPVMTHFETCLVGKLDKIETIAFSVHFKERILLGWKLKNILIPNNCLERCKEKISDCQNKSKN